jgi:uncharacterized protein YdhG (YjbR/CyaY superfamily)
MAEKFTSVEDYLDSFPPDVRRALEEIRATILGAVDGAVETISYNIPTVRVDGRPVVHYAGWKQHLSLYPVPAGDEDLVRELAPYVAGKGTLKFPLDQPIPHDLVVRIARQLSTTTSSS